MTTFALIPAAGKSVRMGRPKLALPLGDRTVLGHVLAALRRANIDRILVVVGPHVPELAPIAAAAGADTLLLPEETADMRATVAAGLQHIEEHFQPQSGDTLLLVPGDHPTLNAGVILLLLEARAGNPEKSIFIPTHRGKRGHPALMDWKHVVGLRSVPEGAGLNTYLRQREAETLLVPTESAEVLIDMDNPADYDRLQTSLAGSDVLRMFFLFSSMTVGLLVGLLIFKDMLATWLCSGIGALVGIRLSDAIERSWHKASGRWRVT